MGARRGSGFQNSQNQITSDFAQDLQANRQNLQRQAIQDLRGLARIAWTKTISAISCS